MNDRFKYNLPKVEYDAICQREGPCVTVILYEQAGRSPAASFFLKIPGATRNVGRIDYAIRTALLDNGAIMSLRFQFVELPLVEMIYDLSVAHNMLTLNAVLDHESSPIYIADENMVYMCTADLVLSNAVKKEMRHALYLSQGWLKNVPDDMLDFTKAKTDFAQQVIEATERKRLAQLF